MSAYVDDILIFTEGSRADHRSQVSRVLEKLSSAGLQLDIGRCEFEVQSTKYLGYFIEASKGIRMDPEKVGAIQEWETPTTAKGVLGFLGFANFYRQFIKGFSLLCAPLTELTRKNAQFRWNEQANTAFEKLKKAFITAPILIQFNPDRETVLSTDSSGYCTGGVLSQYDDNRLLRPVAFFSKKNLSAECNYPIYGKELLAIVKCLRAWDAEPRSVSQFKVITDHKSLEYFTTAQRLFERQIRRWRELSRFSFVIEYSPGKQNVLADALTRRDQDLPTSTTDDRLQQRVAQLLDIHPNGLKVSTGSPLDPEDESSQDKAKDRHTWKAAPARTRIMEMVGEDPLIDNRRIEELWQEPLQLDQIFPRLKDAVEWNMRAFPPDLSTTIRVQLPIAL